MFYRFVMLNLTRNRWHSFCPVDKMRQTMSVTYWSVCLSNTLIQINIFEPSLLSLLLNLLWSWDSFVHDYPYYLLHTETSWTALKRAPKTGTRKELWNCREILNGAAVSVLSVASFSANHSEVEKRYQQISCFEFVLLLHMCNIFISAMYHHICIQFDLCQATKRFF